MAKVCFAWELGQGFGHLVRYVTLIKRLLDRGDEVYFLAKDAARARRVFAEMRVEIEQIEPGSTPADEAFETLHSYPEILHNFGFYAPDALEQQLQQWFEKLRAWQPDVLVVDHSPTAFVANRICQIPMISSGSGFTVPPRTLPMKPMFYWSMHRRENLATSEGRVLSVINEVLARAGIAPLTQFSDLLVADREWLLTYAELDHYGVRADGCYLGSISAPGFGEQPQWAETAGPKVFAYLVTRTIMNSFVDALLHLDINLCLYAPSLKSEELAKLPAKNVFRTESPVDLGLAARQCTAAVTNGGLNTVSAFLRDGVPQLVLPNNVERYMVARRVELVGGGLASGPVHTNNLAASLRAVINDRAFARAAGQFAERYRDVDHDAQTAIMLADIDALSGR